MSNDMRKGRAIYDKFIKKEKAKGKTHAEANQAWKEQKGGILKEQSSSVKVSTKKRSKPRKKEEGFQRPKSLSEKLRTTKLKFRINMNSIRKVY